MSVFKMNKEQKELFDKLTTLQQEISLNSFSGMNDIDSYKASSGKAVKENTMAASVSEILINPNVVAFLDSMKTKVINSAVMSRERMMELLTLFSEIDPNDLKNLSPTMLVDLKPGFDVKLKSMKQLADLAGYEAPKKIEVDVTEELTPWDAININIDG